MDASARRLDLWIFDPRRDLALFIATPLWIVPVVWLTLTQVSVAEVALYVAAFGATGHHLPGLIRAYGDRELFRRFRIRFVVAPLFLTLCCVGLANTDLRSLSVIVLVWGTWHGLAQVFGIVRIYDVKVGCTDARTVLLDRWMCIAWFGAGLFYSPARMANLLETLYAAGVPLLPADSIVGFRSLWGLATAAVTIAFAWHTWVLRRRGIGASPVKLPLMITSFGFWWVAMVAIDDAILGVALFEIFHDVQYLAIAWVFSRNRIAKGHELNAFSRFLFRPDRAMIGLYVTLVLLYGYAIHMPGWVESDVLRRSLLGLVATSALLHFYYDGFIWKVRERTTREGLGLEGGGADVSSRIHQGLGHALKWSLFVVPLAGLAASQLQGPAPALAQRENIVDAVPSAYTRGQLGAALLAAGRPADAAPEFRAAIALDAEDWEQHEGLGAALAATGDLEGAIARYERALEIDPTRSRVHSKLAYALGESGRHVEAIPWLERVERRKQSWDAAFNLGKSLAAAGRSDAAIAQLRVALERNPDASQALRALAAELRKRGEHAQAARHLERARELERREAAVSS